MRYSIEPRVYVKGYGFMPFARIMSNKYGKKLVDTAKTSAADATKTVSKRAIQKTAEETGELVGNKIADNITSVSKKSTKKSTKTLSLHTKKDTYHLNKDNKLLTN